MKKNLELSNNYSDLLNKIEWLNSNHPYGSACIRINDGYVIYFDPVDLSEENIKIKADLILITHSHDDHFSVKTIEKLMKPTTIIVCPVDCEETLLQDHFDFNISIIKPNGKIKFNRTKIQAIHAYSSTAHPESAGWVGYIIETNRYRIYHSGDSGFIPEMNYLRDIDIAFLTVREPYMMSPKEVIKAIEAINPKIAIPIHWIEEERSSIEYIISNSPESIKVINFERK